MLEWHIIIDDSHLNLFQKVQSQMVSQALKFFVLISTVYYNVERKWRSVQVSRNMCILILIFMFECHSKRLVIEL